MRNGLEVEAPTVFQWKATWFSTLLCVTLTQDPHIIYSFMKRDINCHLSWAQDGLFK